MLAVQVASTPADKLAALVVSMLAVEADIPLAGSYTAPGTVFPARKSHLRNHD